MSQTAGYRSLLRATAILGSSSVGAILIGVFSAKIWALQVGPAGIGHLALLQSVVGLTGMVAGAGMGTGVVRFGPALISAGDTAGYSTLVSAAWSVWRVAIFLFAALLLCFPERISNLMGGGIGQWELALLILALAASTASDLQNGVINAYHRVSTLARVTVLGILCGTAASLPFLFWLGSRGIALAYVTNTLLVCLVSAYAYRMEHHKQQQDLNRLPEFRRELLAFGLPYAGSTLLGAGVYHIFPIVIAHEIGEDATGYFRAAATISYTYTGSLLVALAQDFYPRLAAIRHDPVALRAGFEMQFRITMLIAIPLAVGMILGSDVIIPLCYSRDFLPAVSIVDWMMAGASLRLVSGCLNYVVLTCCPGWVALLTEFIGGATWLIASWVLVRMIGLEGLGISLIISQGARLISSACALSLFRTPVLTIRHYGLLAICVIAAVGLVVLKHSFRFSA